MPEARELTDAVCLGCACLCDDLRLTIDDQRVSAADNACKISRRWFEQPVVAANDACFVAGKPVSFDDAIAAAAGLLSDAKRLLVSGLAGVSIDAQRHSVAIADQLGGVVIGGGAASARALALHGSVSATLGEVAQRADVVIFWRCDPATTHPRHFERYSLQPTSKWLPDGRASRTAFAIGSTDTPTAAEADHTIPLAAGCDYEAIATLHAIARKLPVDSDQVLQTTGVNLDAWRSLAAAATSGKYVAVFYDSQLSSSGHAALGAMTRWMAELQNTTRAVSLPLGGGMHHANAAGASSVLAWQSGYAGVVDFSHGYPRPLDVEPQDADALLVVSAESVPVPQGDAPRVVLATTEAGCDLSAEVTFRVAPPGFAARSSAYRSDGVALPLRDPWTADALAAESVLAAIAAKLLATTAASAP